jgi:hypothetical protein
MVRAVHSAIAATSNCTVSRSVNETEGHRHANPLIRSMNTIVMLMTAATTTLADGLPKTKTGIDVNGWSGPPRPMSLAEVIKMHAAARRHRCAARPGTAFAARSSSPAWAGAAVGYPGSMSILVRYITQGRAEGDRPPLSPHRLDSLVLANPEHLTDAQCERRHELTTACPELVGLPASSVRCHPATTTRRKGSCAR